MNPTDFTLLVVDDEELNREVLSRRLGRLGYQVLLANDGQNALDVIRQKPIDLVLLDVMMPGMDGLETLTTIRETHSLVDLPVIMATARDQNADIVAALQMGANDYVSKPINFPLILARIQTQLAMKRTRSQASPTRGGESNTVADAPRPAARSGNDNAIMIGEYEVLGELGRGGMGVVYKAKHQRMQRLVALKVIDHQHLASADAEKRFYREVQAAAQLAHPNIVIAFDAGQADDTHYLAMELVEGMDLCCLVRQTGPQSVANACDYVRQTALGLQHAKDKGLVHRDIKPSNLLLTRAADSGGAPAGNGVIKILDFGLALIHQPTDPSTSAGHELTREGRVVGSVDYMAPEQWKNAHKVDIRADLYSLGCTFYYLLTGAVPFPGDEPMEKMLKHNLDEPAPVETLRPEVPSKVANVVRRLMAKKPEQRYQTPGELAELLKWLVQATPEPAGRGREGR